MPAISVENISKSFGRVKALDHVSFEVERGELFGLIGPDGAGKTTLFRLLATLLTPDSGSASVDGFDTVKEKVVNSLKGKKIAAYYGCLLLRPNKVMRMDDPENPTIIEDLIRALGAEAVVYARRNECCGGYISVESPEAAKKNSNAIIENAKAAGAEMIITACPLCKYNLEKNGADIPVVYFTELLAEALGVKEDTNGK